ncbi:MAG: M1 family aminopeptidase, partial [Nitrospinota bacterium]
LKLNGDIKNYKGELRENSLYGKAGYEVEIEIPQDIKKSSSYVILELKYTAAFDKKPEKPKFSREFISDEALGYIGEEGTFLSPSALWYPVMEGGKDFAYKINITSGKGYEYITAGDRIRREEKGDKIITSFQFLNPAEEIFLVGGKYKISEGRYNDVKIYTYFFPEDEDLSDGYIESVKNYLKLYEGLLGRYPFGQFSVVSNFLPTGYGFPTFTLLGQEILRLPFIKDTSLGHEVLHNWWGNSVYVDYESGNWCEGLTTYLADHYYKEMKGEGINYRKEMLRGYSNYVNEGNDFPLKDFKSRTETFTRAIGYNKSAFVFHMLRIELGDERFFTALREIIKRQSFKVTSWIDLQKIFEDVNGQSLGWFFKQWIEDRGAPFLKVKNAAYNKNGEGYITSFKLVQDGKPYLLNVPIEITTEKGKVKKLIRIKDKEESIEIRTADRPLSLSIDPHADIFRLLHKEEIPPTISRVMGDKNRIIVLPTGGEKEIVNAYREISGVFLEGKPLIKNDSDLTMEDIKNNALYIFGGLNENKVLAILIDKLPEGTLIEKDKVTINNKSYQAEGYFTVLTVPNKLNPDKAIMIIIGFDPNSIRATGGKLIHYGKYSYLAFKDGKNIDKGIWDTKDSPLIVNLEKK